MRRTAHERRLKTMVDRMGDEDIILLHRLLAHRVAAIRARALEDLNVQDRREPSGAIPALR